MGKEIVNFTYKHFTLDFGPGNERVLWKSLEMSQNKARLFRSCWMTHKDDESRSWKANRKYFLFIDKSYLFLKFL